MITDKLREMAERMARLPMESRPAWADLNDLHLQAFSPPTTLTGRGEMKE